MGGRDTGAGTRETGTREAGTVWPPGQSAHMESTSVLTSAITFIPLGFPLCLSLFCSTFAYAVSGEYECVGISSFPTMNLEERARGQSSSPLTLFSRKKSFNTNIVQRVFQLKHYFHNLHKIIIYSKKDFKNPFNLLDMLIFLNQIDQ